MQLQGIDTARALRSLERARVDMLVLEPGDTVRDHGGISSQELVARVRASRGVSREHKICVAYLNIGQAEDYRQYWSPDWRAPTQSAPGNPDFLLCLDPDGWPGNYPCRYWDPRWKAIVFGSHGALLDRILEAGFDGCYLDWVLGYSEPAVARAAALEGVDPARAMVDFLLELRTYARQTHPNFVLIAQNGAELVERDPRFAHAIDGLAHEDLSFRGEASAQWDDSRAGGIDASAERRGPHTKEDPLLACLKRVRALGPRVFTIDYAVRTEDVEYALRRSRAAGFVATVSRTPLDRLPPHVLRQTRAQPSRPSGLTRPAR